MKEFNLWCQDCNCGCTGKERDFQLSAKNEKEATKIHCPNQWDRAKPTHIAFYLKVMGEVLTTAIIDKGKHAKGRTPKEKRERANRDFIKNTLPGLLPSDRKHFEKKFKEQKEGKRNPLK